MASLHDASFFCIPETALPHTEQINYRLLYCVISLCSGFLGMFGSCYQLFAWKQKMTEWPRRRSSRPTTNPEIIFYLAASNLMSCLGVIIRSMAMLLTKAPHVSSVWVNITNTSWYEIYSNNKCDNQAIPHGEKNVFIWGSIVEAFTQFSFGASVIWTFLYSVDTYSQLVGFHISSKAYHSISWVLAGVMAIGSQLSVSIGLTPPYSCADGPRLIIRYFFAYMPMLVVLILNPVFLWSTHRQAKKRMVSYSVTFTDTERKSLTKLRQKFITIVFLFTLCWVPNQIDSALQISLNIDCIYSSTSTFNVFFPLWVIEAFLNPLQGLFNCLVFGRRFACCDRTGERIRVSTQDSFSVISSERQTLL
ncbi:G-protein coupled receptor 143-like [Liolophura sinensis]|uniref:G-protein coupled receptor 143-like n=1 Tax=Liolophura sinensis TaxID=3198878 RepID=UPI003158CB93